jgi:hypothetical protein
MNQITTNQTTMNPITLNKPIYKLTTPQTLANAAGISLRAAKRYLRAHHSRQSFDGGETYSLSANDLNRARGALRGQRQVEVVGFKQERN